MRLNKILNYLREELSDISTEKKLYHYTNLPALVKIAESGGGLCGGKESSSLNSKGIRELCTTRKDLKLNPEGFQLSRNVDNVKFILFVDRILASQRGIKKPASYNLYMKKAKEEFDEYAKTIEPELLKLLMSKPLDWWISHIK